ncbi:hypothetical protein [Foliimonas ilicis]
MLVAIASGVIASIVSAKVQPKR